VACDPARLVARITRWEGAAGSWIGHLEVANSGPATCRLPTTARPQLVDAAGLVLIDAVPGTTPAALASPTGPPASAPSSVTLAAGAVARTLVRVANYCGPAPRTPLSLAFLFPDGGRMVASPLSPTDETVPACMGVPGSAGSIEMQPWSI
jgi:hypothetical protein